MLALDGDPSWSYDCETAKKQFINKVIDFNNDVQENERVQGVVLDIEPASTSEWKKNKNTALANYVQTQKEIYQEVKKNNMIDISCIPVWFDSTDVNLLEDLVENACDGISVMNYSKKKMIENIRNEVTFAKKYNKTVDSVVEFIEPDGDSVTNTISFYNDGIDAAEKKQQEVLDEYQYSKLGKGYHYYKPLCQILGIHSNV